MMAFWVFYGSNFFLMCLSIQHNSRRNTWLRGDAFRYSNMITELIFILVRRRLKQPRSSHAIP
ncbi:hypothetical protein CEJ86_29110 [Sinorhizobium meliloti]|uniref:Uncharacterized protein n=1 Tax=Rhizobium meliloti TaxID=382 RepID=A0A2J0YUI1_RHIML|nr:hypothetical protein CEJ86_29110 [Sinorhizobium meliloti]